MAEAEKLRFKSKVFLIFEIVRKLKEKMVLFLLFFVSPLADHEVKVPFVSLK